MKISRPQRSLLIFILKTTSHFQLLWLQQYFTKVFAAIVRVISVVRSIVAMEEGAIGPDKDCGYEGPFIKAITGIPISMEGKTAACAHLSPLGNIASACADLWSNESVQNIKLLSGMAPVAYLEQLEYDVRLKNVVRLPTFKELLSFANRDLKSSRRALRTAASRFACDNLRND